MTEENKDTKEVTEDWEAYVKSEVAAALEKFLPYSTDGKLGIVYKKSIIEETESGPVYDDNKKSGVEVIISLTFAESMEM